MLCLTRPTVVLFAALLAVAWPQASDASPQLTESRSSRQHADGRFHPLDLPLSGPRAVEPRRLRNGQALVLLVFDRDLTSIGDIATSYGTVESWSGIRSAFPNSIQVAVTGLPDDAYYLTVTVNDAADASGTLPKAEVTVGMLRGDVDANRRVNPRDVRRVARASNQLAQDGDNFLLDLDLSSRINPRDVRIAAQRSNRSLPAAEPFFVSSPQDQQTTPGVATPAQPVTLDDFDTPAAGLSLTATSSNPTLLPTSGITLAGSGANRTVALQPAPGQTGTATVTLTVSDGSRSATTAFILTADNNVPPQAIASAGNFLGRAPLTTTFDARRSNDPNGNIASYTWDFGDGTTGSGVAPTKTYNTPGTYNATLTVTDNAGLADSVTHVITVASSAFNVNATPTANEARRFLWQAAFGPTDDDVQNVVSRGYAGWIDDQINLINNPTVTAGSRLTQDKWDAAEVYRANNDQFINQHLPWSNIVVETPDQLRHRMAWALIQIIVLNNRQDDAGPEASLKYYNFYLDHGLGNYADLLRDVTFSSNMGAYLTYLKNEKADPATGSVPDENYAREIMQLFSIGLHELNLDGTFKRNAGDELIPTYDNETIKQFARVFTGLYWSDIGNNFQEKLANPMRMLSWKHEFGPKQLLDYGGSAAGPAAANGGFIPARSGSDRNEANGLADINFAIDNVFNHPNTPPFISKQLIQRLVTSNPTPAYVQRVASVFVDNGSGERGDLGAVAKAILLDPEARDTTYGGNPLFGKLVEPYLMKHALYRVLDRTDDSTQNGVTLRVADQGFRDQASYAQRYMDAPSVFNFYLPDYTVPNSGLDRRAAVGPEMQIADEIIVLASLDEYRRLHLSRGGTQFAQVLDDWMPLAGNINTLIDLADDRLMYGRMSPEMRAILHQALSAYGNNEVSERVKVVVWLILGSPEFLLMD